MDYTHEIEELTELTQCPGWGRFVAMAEEAYGPARLAAVARDLRTRKDISANEVGAQVLATVAGMDAVGIALRMPVERLRKLLALQGGVA